MVSFKTKGDNLFVYFQKKKIEKVSLRSWSSVIGSQVTAILKGGLQMGKVRTARVCYDAINGAKGFLSSF